MLVVPALSPECAAASALRAENLAPVVVVLDDDQAYGRLLTELWASNEDVIIIEHDVIPWPGAVKRLASCPEPYCAHQYLIAGQLGGTLGCVKFSSDLTAAHPDVPEAWTGGHWGTVDIKLTNALWDRGIRAPHRHQPPVAHLHLYADELIQAAARETL
jgi:hypothetical protein